MLSCKALVQLHSSDYLDHHLPHRQRLGVRVHLMLCGNCRRFVKQLTLIRDVLQHSALLPTDENQVQAIAEKLHKAYHEKTFF